MIMTGSPNDLGIPEKKEPLSDKEARIEERQHAEGDLDDGRKKTKVLNKVWLWLGINHAAVFVIVILEGFIFIQFDLDPLVLASLIGGVMGSSTVYFIRRSADFAYSRD